MEQKRVSSSWSPWPSITHRLAGIHCASWGLSVCAVAGLGTKTQISLLCFSCMLPCELQAGANYQQDTRQAHRLMVSYHITTRTFGNLITSKARQQLSVVLGRHGKHRDHGGRQPNTWRFWVLPLGDAFLWCSMAQRSIFCWLHWTEAEQEHCLSWTYDFMFSLFDSWISFGSAWIDHSCLMITSPG